MEVKHSSPENVPETSSHVVLKEKADDIHWLSSEMRIVHQAGCGINPLIDAATEVFASMSELKSSVQHVQPSLLHERLKKEIEAFSAKVQGLDYSSEVLLASRYALCATLDDCIRNTSWGGHDYWHDYRLLFLMQQDASCGDRFFLILDRIQREPKLYIDLLEFMYICLGLGFKGDYRATAFGNNQIGQLTDLAYMQIRLVRGEFKKTLSPRIRRPKVNTAKKKKKIRSMIHIVLMTLIILGVVGIVFNVVFRLTMKQMVSPYQVTAGVSQQHE
jgi:type VI secretion system protein ImpK